MAYKSRYFQNLNEEKDDVEQTPSGQYKSKYFQETQAGTAGAAPAVAPTTVQTQPVTPAQTPTPARPALPRVSPAAAQRAQVGAAASLLRPAAKPLSPFALAAQTTPSTTEADKLAGAGGVRREAASMGTNELRDTYDAAPSGVRRDVLRGEVDAREAARKAAIAAGEDVARGVHLLQGVGGGIAATPFVLYEHGEQQVKNRLQEHAENPDLLEREARLQTLKDQADARLATYTMPPDEATLNAIYAEYNAAKAELDALRVKTPVSADKYGMQMLAEAQEHSYRASEGLPAAGRFVVDTAGSVAQNAALLPLAAVNPSLPLFAMSAIAGANKAAEVSRAGGSPSEALIRGAVSGGIEAATEKIPLDNFLEMARGTTGGLGDVLNNLLRQVGTEATEEGISYAANYLADKVAGDPNAEFTVQELLAQMAAGGLSGGMFWAGGTGVGAVNRAAGNARELRQLKTATQNSAPVQGAEQPAPAGPLPMELPTASKADVSADASRAARDVSNELARVYDIPARVNPAPIRDVMLQHAEVLASGNITQDELGRLADDIYGVTVATIGQLNSGFRALIKSIEATPVSFGDAGSAAARGLFYIDDTGGMPFDDYYRSLQDACGDWLFPNEATVEGKVGRVKEALRLARWSDRAVEAMLGDNADDYYNATRAKTMEVLTRYASGTRAGRTAPARAERTAASPTAVTAAMPLELPRVARNTVGLTRDASFRRSLVDTKTERMLDALGQAVGVNVRFVPSIDAGNGMTANGRFANGLIEIALDAEDPVRVVFAHELVHRIRDVAPEAYGDLASFVLDNMKGDDVAHIWTEMEKRYQTDSESAAEEMIADAVSYLLEDSDLLDRLVLQKRNVIQRLLDAVRDFIRRIKAQASGRGVQRLAAAQRQAYAELTGKLGELESTLAGAIKAAAEKAASAEGQREELSDAGAKYSLRAKEPPKRTGVAYKVFYAKDGQLYPPMVANPGGAGTPVGVWLDADVGALAPSSKTGRAQVQAGGKGTSTGRGSLAFRPGWHLGDIPLATQFARTNPATGEKDLFPADFVWAVCEYAMDVDYQEEAMSYGYTDSGKFRHAYAGLPKLPEDGYYRYRTNPKPDTVPWVITGAMRVNRILTDAETDAIVRASGATPMARQGGPLDLARLGLETTGESKPKFSLKRPVEATDQLIAVHNLSATQLGGALELGGFAMPSIAVVKPGVQHSGYGDISVIFGRGTIDPAASRANKVYSGDAYTPSFPTLGYKIDRMRQQAIEERVDSALEAGGYGRTFRSGLDSYNMEDKVERSQGDLVAAYERNDAVRLTFLLETGRMFEAARSPDGQVDRYATQGKLREAFDEGTQAAYREWLEDLFAGVIEKRGVRNGVELFTPSGNRRGFEALHWGYTLENIVRAMAGDEKQKGGSGLGMSIFGASAKEYSSVDEARRESGRIQTMADNEYEAIKKQHNDEFYSIAMRFADGKDWWDAAEILCEAVAKRSTREGIHRYLNQWTDVYRADDAIVDDLLDLVDDIRGMPTEYFEAKPRRAVGFDEVVAVVVPDTLGSETRRELERRGVTVVDYAAGDEQARLEAVNSVEGARFSQKGGREFYTQIMETRRRAKGGASAALWIETRKAAELAAGGSATEEAVDTAEAVQPETEAADEQATAHEQETARGLEAPVAVAEQRELGRMSIAEMSDVWKKVKKLQRIADRMAKKNKLSDGDKRIVKMMLEGLTTVEEIGDHPNRKEIISAYRIQAELRDLREPIVLYNMQRRQMLAAQAEELLQGSEAWVDKKHGIAYERETMERNIRDIVRDEQGKPDRARAQAVIDTYFTPVHKNEAARTRYRNEMNERVRRLGISAQVARGNKVSEAYAVQYVGEATDNIARIERSNGALESVNGGTIEDWRAGLIQLAKENPNLDMDRVREGVEEFRKIYDELFQKVVEARVRNGYEPPSYRRGYFPHFSEQTPDGLVAKLKSKLFGGEITPIPADINGLTHTFRPGIRWSRHVLPRVGFETTYDVLRGFELYLGVMSDVIYHTDDTQRLRALSDRIRERSTTDEVRERIKEVKDDETLSDEERMNSIAEIWKEAPYALGKFVVELEEYTNLLAGKRSGLDRNAERHFDRSIYNAVENVQRRAAANMIGYNLSSALTNFIPLVQGGAQLRAENMARAALDLMRAVKNDDGFVAQSTFLTNRRGVNPLKRTAMDRFVAGAGKPMEIIDSFTSEVLVRARWHENRASGMSDDAAMDEADAWAAGVMADRSKGALPTLFESRNPLIKPFTMFQLEVNNQLSWLLKDVPEEVAKRGTAYLVAFLFKFLLGSLLYNDIYETAAGRRPALDPIGMLNETVGDYTGYELPNTVEAAAGLLRGKAPSFEVGKKGGGEAAAATVKRVAQEMPFVGGLVGGGRLPTTDLTNVLPRIGTAASNLVTGDGNARKQWSIIGKELSGAAFALALPTGGNQLRKTYQGIRAAMEKGSYTVDSAGRDVMQYPVHGDEAAWVALFGKAATSGARAWTKSGFANESAATTALYKGLVDMGTESRVAYDTVTAVTRAVKSDATTRAQERMSVLDSAELTAEGKLAVYYALVAGEKERAVMDELAGTADAGAVYAALTGIRSVTEVRKAGVETDDAADVQDEPQAVEKIKALNATAPPQEVKSALYYALVAGEKEQAVMDELAGTADKGAVYDALSGMRIYAGTGTGQAQRKREYLLSAKGLTPVQKAKIGVALGIDSRSMNYSSTAALAVSQLTPELQAKALTAKSKGVSNEVFLATYEAQKGITGDKDQKGNTIALSAARKKKAAVDAAGKGLTQAQLRTLYDLYGISRSVWSDGAMGLVLPGG